MSREVVLLSYARTPVGRYLGTLTDIPAWKLGSYAIAEAVKRSGVEMSDIEEVIMATNPDTEGEATAMYLARLLRPFGVRVTRLAYGIPVGGHLEFADDATLMRAVEGRRDI